MTTAQATQEGHQPNADTLDTSTHDAGNGDQGGGGQDPVLSEEEAAMEAGFATATGASESDGNATSTTSSTETDNGGAEGGDGTHAARTDASGDQQHGTQTGDDDPEIPGLGKASAIRQRLERLDGLEKAQATANGHIGHLKSLIQQAGKGKPITKDSLKKISEEFGEEYAAALAEDLTAAGVGGGAAVDEEALARIVSEQTAKATEAGSQKLEARIVRVAHKDAGDYFAGGKHNAEFLKFVATLPPEKQQELASTWDSDVIIPVLDQFKESRDKANQRAASQQRRVDRAAAPSTTGGVDRPSIDPMEVGFQRAGGGRRMGAQRSAGR